MTSLFVTVGAITVASLVALAVQSFWRDFSRSWPRLSDVLVMIVAVPIYVAMALMLLAIPLGLLYGLWEFFGGTPLGR